MRIASLKKLNTNTYKSVSSIFQRANRWVDQQYRRKAWIEFYKAVSAKHLSHRRALEYAHSSLHFAEDAYEQGQSPKFLKRVVR